MSQHQKLLISVLIGTKDRNMLFSDLCSLLEYLGFQRRVRGDHFIFTKETVEEILNLQPMKNGKAKPYQVKQVRELILRYQMGGGRDE